MAEAAVLGLRTWGFRVQDFRVWDLDCWVQASGFEVLACPRVGRIVDSDWTRLSLGYPSTLDLSLSHQA